MKTTHKIVSGVMLVGVGFVAGFFIPHHNSDVLKKTEMNGMQSMNHDMTGMSGAMNMSVSEMSELEGDDFDKKFIEDMIVHHQGAVEMARIAQKKSTREEVKALSADIIGSQTKEVSIMKQWLSLWFK